MDEIARDEASLNALQDVWPEDRTEISAAGSRRIIPIRAVNIHTVRAPHTTVEKLDSRVRTAG